jgi:glucosamine-phosphate N-acetyltransferase
MKQFEQTLLKGQIQSQLPTNYTIRPLEADDYDQSYLELLAQLTVVGNITKDQFNEQFKKSIDSGKYYLVIESKNRIVGAGSIQLERKYIHDLGLVGHIEGIQLLIRHCCSGF